MTSQRKPDKGRKPVEYRAMFENIPYFANELPADLEQVNAAIREQIQSDVVLIRQIGEHIIGAGGKRLRPIVAILSGKALGYDEPLLYRQAAMVEFIHTSTLLHDDVVDQSDLRRGRPTANSAFGNAAAVLVGDFFYTRAFQLMVKADSMAVMRVMSDATNIIAAGEVMQLMNIGDASLDESRYLEVIYRKTAKLFEAACQVAAIIAGAKPEAERALALYGAKVGSAFQIVDDVLDYAGDVAQTGKNVGDDLAEGKVTLPLIYLLKNGSDKAQKDVKAALEKADRSAFELIHAHVANSGALPYCLSFAEKIAQEAIEALNALDANPYVETLRALAIESVKRAR